MPTRKPVLAAVAATILGSSAAVAADGPDLGRVVTAQEIAAWSLSVGPDGAGLVKTWQSHDITYSSRAS